jgi:hypothetical protein
MVVVLAARPRGVTIGAQPAGVLVAADSDDAAVAAANSWAEANDEWEFGPHALSVFPFTGRDDLGDAPAMLIQVDYPTDSAEVREMLRRETELIEASRRDDLLREHDYFSTEQIQVLQRHRSADRRRRFLGFFRGRRHGGA